MNKELLHMQMLAGIITESEYKSKLIEEMKSINENETLLEYDSEWTIEDEKEKMSGLSFPLAGVVAILKSVSKLGDPGQPIGDSRYFIGMAETILKYLKEGGYKPSEQ
jgi:hypothetical protein